MEHKHITYDEIENYINASEENISKEELDVFTKFDDRLENCEVCGELFSTYTSLSTMIDSELEEDVILTFNSTYMMDKNFIKQDTILKYPSPIPALNYAASLNDGFFEFFSETITHDEIISKLYFMGNEHKQVYIELVFDKYQETIPFELELNFVTTNDHKAHTINIPVDNQIIDPEKGIKAMRSKLLNHIDYSGGIEANYTITIKHLNP